jgi:hypothetical protein
MSVWFDTTPPALMKFYEPVGVEFFGLFSKQLSRSSFNFFITCEMNSFQMFLETCTRPEVRQCQSRAVGCRTATAMLSIVPGVADSCGLALSGQRDWFVLSATLGFSRKTRIWFFYLDHVGLLFVNNASVVLEIENRFPVECWVLNFFLSWRCWVTGFAVLGRSNASADRSGRAV